MEGGGRYRCDRRGLLNWAVVTAQIYTRVHAMRVITLHGITDAVNEELQGGLLTSSGEKQLRRSSRRSNDTNSALSRHAKCCRKLCR